MRTSHKLLSSLLMLTITVLAQGKGPKQGPHGGDIIEEGPFSFEVAVDPQADSASVYVLSGKKRLSGNKMELVLLENTGTGQTVGLQALDLRDGPPVYQGTISPHMGSYMGFELRFSTGNRSKKVLRNLPPRRGKEP